jgi:hypothetical protein
MTLRSEILPKGLVNFPLPAEIPTYLDGVMQTMEFSFMDHSKHHTGGERGLSASCDFSTQKWELITIFSITFASMGGDSTTGLSLKPFVENTSIQ